MTGARFPDFMRRHAETLADQGYRIVPIRPGTKRPTEFEWQRFGHRQTEEDVARFVRGYPEWGIGILTARTPAVDIDTLHPRAALELEQLAVERFGTAPLRIGQAPKRALLYRTDVPFEKIRSAEFTMPGDKPGDKGHAVEILGDGQQLVAFAIHPETGRAYEWPDDSPLDVHAADLPAISEEQARAFIADAELVFARYGGKRRTKLRDDNAEPHRPNAQQLGDPETVRDALRHIDNADLHYDDWITVGLALRGALGEAGRQDWLDWSARSAKDDPAITARAWDSFRPDRIGAGTIFYLAAQNGWSRKGEIAEPHFRAKPLSAEEASARLDAELRDWFDRAAPLALARQEQRRRRALELKPYAVTQQALALDPSDLPAAERRIRARIGRTIAREVKAQYGLDSLTHGPRKAIKASAGLGKTARTVRQIMERPELWGLHIWIFVPTLELAERLAAQFGPGPQVKVMRGRLAERPGAPGTMCARPAVVERAAHLGLNVFKAACSDGEGRRCPFYDACHYIAQWQDHEPGIRIFASEYLSLPKPLGLPGPDLVIIDESVVAVLAGGKDFGPDRLTETPAWKWQDDGEAADLMDVLRRVRAAIEAPRPLLAELRAQGLDAETLAQAARIADGGEDYAAGVTPDTPDSEALDRLDALEQSERIKIAKLLHQLAREIAIPREQSHSVELRRNWPVRVGNAWERMARLFVWWRKRPLIRAGVPVLLIDADADPEINRQFFGERLEHVEIPVRRNATVTQCRDASLSRLSLLPPDNLSGPRAAEIREKAERRMERLRAIIRRKALAGRTLVVLPLPVRRAITGETDAKLPVSTEWEGATITHFGRIRGVDDWKGHDAVIIVGREQPPPLAIEGIARAIWWDSPEPLDLTGGYSRQVRGYRMREGLAPGARAWVHPDGRAQRVLELHRERESAQAIDRLRLIHADQPKDVLILSDLPLDIDVDRLATWKEIAEGGGRIARAFAERGILPLSPADMAAAFPALWGTAKAAELALSRSRKTPLTSEIESISRMRGVFKASYRRAGARGPAATALLDSRLPDPRAALEAMVGPLAHFEMQHPAPAAPEPEAPAPNGWRYEGPALYDGARLVARFDGTGYLRLSGEAPPPRGDPFSLDDYDADRPRLIAGRPPPLRDVLAWIGEDWQ